MVTALFGIDGGALGLAISLLVLFLAVVYFALIYWTYLDARRRIEDPVLVACATAASLFPFVGTVVYTILRPPEFIEDRRERELELRSAELRLRQLIEQSCPHCEYPIERNYVRCPNCERRLREPCRKCRKPLDPKWGICPYCETEVRKTGAAAGGRGERDSRGRRSGLADRGGRSPRDRDRDRPGRTDRDRSGRDRDRDRDRVSRDRTDRPSAVYRGGGADGSGSRGNSSPGSSRPRGARSITDIG